MNNADTIEEGKKKPNPSQLQRKQKKESGEPLTLNNPTVEKTSLSAEKTPRQLPSKGRDASKVLFALLGMALLLLLRFTTKRSHE